MKTGGLTDKWRLFVSYIRSNHLQKKKTGGARSLLSGPSKTVLSA